MTLPLQISILNRLLRHKISHILRINRDFQLTRFAFISQKLFRRLLKQILLRCQISLAFRLRQASRRSLWLVIILRPLIILKNLVYRRIRSDISMMINLRNNKLGNLRIPRLFLKLPFSHRLKTKTLRGFMANQRKRAGILLISQRILPKSIGQLTTSIIWILERFLGEIVVNVDQLENV